MGVGVALSGAVLFYAVRITATHSRRAYYDCIESSLSSLLPFFILSLTDSCRDPFY